MRCNYPGEAGRTCALGHRLFTKTQRPFVLGGPSLSPAWVLPAPGPQAGSGPITSGSRPPTAGSSLCSPTRTCKYQQKPVLTSPFVLLALSGSVPSLSALCTTPKKAARHRPASLPGSGTSSETHHLPSKQELPVFPSSKYPSRPVSTTRLKCFSLEQNKSGFGGTQGRDEAKGQADKEGGEWPSSAATSVLPADPDRRAGTDGWERPAAAS